MSTTFLISPSTWNTLLFLSFFFSFWLYNAEDTYDRIQGSSAYPAELPSPMASSKDSSTLIITTATATSYLHIVIFPTSMY